MDRPYLLEILAPGCTPIRWTDQVRVEGIESLELARRGTKGTGHDLWVLHDSDQSELLLKDATAPVVVVDDHRDVDRAVVLLRLGAMDYVEAIHCETACLKAVVHSGTATHIKLPPHRLRVVQANLVERERRATVGKLAAGVAHSINNPAAYVVANVDELRECMAPLQDLTVHAFETLQRTGTDSDRLEFERLNRLARTPQVFKQIGEMVAESLEGMGRIRDIVHDLRGFSALDDEAPMPIDLGEAIDSALQIAQSELDHPVKIAIQVPELPPVLGSNARLSQVVLQLLLNALQSFDDDHAGERVLAITGRVNQGAIELVIRDNGRGMDKQTLGRIWDPFFTTQSLGALGLGLPICQDIIARHGGTLNVESSLNEGTTVTIRLPSMQDAVQFSLLDRPPEEAADPLQTARILVVDDEPAIVRCIKRLLRAAQEVRTATSGQEALEWLLEGASPDLILCDLMMPGVSGVDIYERVLKSRPELESRILFITGGAFTDRTRSFCEKHHDRLIEKPFESNVLRNQLREVLKKRTGAPAPVLVP